MLYSTRMKRYKVVIGVQPRLSKLFFVNNLNCVPMVIFRIIGSGLSIRIIAIIPDIDLSEKLSRMTTRPPNLVSYGSRVNCILEGKLCRQFGNPPLAFSL